MGTIMSQHRSTIVKPNLVWVSENDDKVNIFASDSCEGENYIILGTYRTRERAKEILEELFKSEYYEMPME